LAVDSLPNAGGIADYIGGLMEHTTSGIDWSLWTSVEETWPEEEDLPYCVHRVPLPKRRRGERTGDSISPLRTLNTGCWMWEVRKQAMRTVQHIRKTCRPDLIIMGSWDLYGWCSACRRQNIPYAMIVHGMELLRKLPPGMSSVRKRDMSGAEFIIANSTPTLQLVRDMIGSKVEATVVNPGVNVRRYLPASDGSSLKTLESMGVGRRKFILTMGRLIYRKGFDLAAEGFSQMASEFPDVDLIIAGDGAYRDQIDRRVAKTGLEGRIKIIGKVSEAEKAALLQHCEFFMMPNRFVANDYEGFGIVFLEANAYGKAVIGGQVDGVVDAVSHGVSGLLADTTSDADVAACMRRFLTDLAFRNACGDRGMKRIHRDFAWTRQGLVFVDSLSRYGFYRGSQSA